VKKSGFSNGNAGTSKGGVIREGKEKNRSKKSKPEVFGRGGREGVGGGFSLWGVRDPKWGGASGGGGQNGRGRLSYEKEFKDVNTRVWSILSVKSKKKQNSGGKTKGKHRVGGEVLRPGIFWGGVDSTGWGGRVEEVARPLRGIQSGA